MLGAGHPYRPHRHRDRPPANGHRTKLRKLLGDPKVSTIVVEHREATPAAHARTVVVLDETELAHDLARDLTEALTAMRARLYARRSAARRAASAVAAIQAEPDKAAGDPA